MEESETAMKKGEKTNRQSTYIHKRERQEDKKSVKEGKDRCEWTKKSSSRKIDKEVEVDVEVLIQRKTKMIDNKTMTIIFLQVYDQIICCCGPAWHNCISC